MNKQDLLALFTPKVVPATIMVDGRELQLRIRELSADEVFTLQQMRTAKNAASQRKFSAELLASTLMDEEDKPIFTKQDADALLRSKISAFNSLVAMVAKKAGLVDDEPTRIEALTAVLKEIAEDPTDAQQKAVQVLAQFEPAANAEDEGAAAKAGKD